MGDVLTTHEVADICNVHRATVVRWIKEGVLPAQQTLGGRYRVRRTELERLASERDLCLADRPSPSETAASVVMPQENSPLASASVLIVDDDYSMRALVTSALSSASIASAAVDTGYAGLDAVLKNRNIRILVLDLHLPGLDGIDTLVEMHRIRPDLKIIVASGSLRYFDSEQVRNLSHAQLEKPFALGALVTCCRTLGVQGSAQSRTLARSG
jgi:excisionase family DNA binding protein